MSSQDLQHFLKVGRRISLNGNRFTAGGVRERQLFSVQCLPLETAQQIDHFLICPGG
jgi:hypothetical protein